MTIRLDKPGRDHTVGGDIVRAVNGDSANRRVVCAHPLSKHDVAAVNYSDPQYAIRAFALHPVRRAGIQCQVTRPGHRLVEGDVGPFTVCVTGLDAHRTTAQYQRPSHHKRRAGAVLTAETI